MTIKRLKQEMELSFYTKVIEGIMMKDIKFEHLDPKTRLELFILVGKVAELDNKYAA